MTVSFSSAGHTRRPTFSQVVSSSSVSGDKKRVVFEVPKAHSRKLVPRLDPILRQQLACHIAAYSEMLANWGYAQKRAELLKSTEKELQSIFSESIMVNKLQSSPLGVVPVCANCGAENILRRDNCPHCNVHSPSTRCSVCRLPIKGLSYTCLSCLHDSHLRCWTMRKSDTCATGCGCPCSKLASGDEQNSSSSATGPMESRGRPLSSPMVQIRQAIW